MKFQSISEEEAKKALLLPEGIYDFEVVEAEDRVSKKGNEMIAVKLRVFSDRGERHVHAYLMEAMRFQLIHFCKATGLWAKYEAGDLQASDCTGRTGKVELIVEEQPGYQPKNSAKDYVVQKDGEPLPTVVRNVTKPAYVPEEDGGVPF